MFGLPKQGNGIGFHRMTRCFAELGIPQDYFALRSIVVTGSNGKGSTSRFIYSLLQQKFSRVGCFTSPHLIDVTERFEINGIKISYDEFEKYKNRVLEFNSRISNDGDFIGAFELFFLVAVQYFHEHSVESVVWEVGIGGRYDPTRMLLAEVVALTSLDLEHTELLGVTKELIAYDKLDVVRPRGIAIVSLSVETALNERLRAYAHVSDRTIHLLSETCSILSPVVKAGRQYFTIHELDNGNHQLDREFSIPLIGLHQAENALTSIETVNVFLTRHDKSLTDIQIQTAFSQTSWPGRLEQISIDPSIWIDVGHTPDALRRVIHQILQLYPRAELLVVYGVSYNKNISEITRLIEANFDAIVLTRAYKNGTDVERLAEYIQDKQKVKAAFDRLEDAVSYAIAEGARKGKIVIVLGGLFLAVEFKHAFNGENPQTLQFF
ncbi:MAG: hypothetical protein IPO91_18775 [Chloroflexi bacterium]|nr:hypothetical protein [Chloroflexota bacterium]